MGETVPVHLSKDLHDRLAAHVDAAGFDDVEAYVTFVLEEMLRDEAAPPADGGGGEGYSEDDEAQVKERLQSLGYL